MYTYTYIYFYDHDLIEQIKRVFWCWILSWFFYDKSQMWNE